MSARKVTTTMNYFSSRRLSALMHYIVDTINGIYGIYHGKNKTKDVIALGVLQEMIGPRIPYSSEVG